MSEGSLAKNVWEPLYTLPEPCRATPTSAASRGCVPVNRAAWAAQSLLPTETPPSTRNKGGPLQKLCVGVRRLEAEISANWELTFSSELTELNLPLG